MGEARQAQIGVIGGSGLYDLAQLEDPAELVLDTPFGRPSDTLRLGSLGGSRVAFLSRHGRGHTLLPSEINFRANIFAMKQLGVERVLSVSAVGSMREDVHPRDVVLVDQFIDRTHHRVATFFGKGIVAHVGLADPVCADLRGVLQGVLQGERARVHDGGTYVCMEGPAFSTRAESKLYRTWGVDVIGMTNLQEARLCREAEICYATLAMVTDYDCWHEDEDDVSVGTLLENLRANASLAATVLDKAIRKLPPGRNCACSSALSHAIITPAEAMPAATRKRLAPLLDKYLETD